MKYFINYLPLVLYLSIHSLNTIKSTSIEEALNCEDLNCPIFCPTEETECKEYVK